MKIRPEHLDVMRAAIKNYAEKCGGWRVLVEKYETGEHSRSDTTKDLQMRFCFDMMHSADLTPFVCRALYPYCNDEHIYTALKAICPKVTRRY